MRAVLIILATLLSSAALAEEGVITIGFVTQERNPVEPVSPLERQIRDEGIAGARLGIADNTTTGRFTGQRFRLVERVAKENDKPEDVIRELSVEGIRLVVSDLDAPLLLAAASAPEAREMLLINARAPDDALRNESCRANVFIPFRAGPCWPMPSHNI